MGIGKLAEDPRFATGADRVRNRQETVAIVADILQTKSRDEWMTLFEEHHIPCSPLHVLGKLSAHARR